MVQRHDMTMEVHIMKDRCIAMKCGKKQYLTQWLVAEQISFSDSANYENTAILRHVHDINKIK